MKIFISIVLILILNTSFSQTFETLYGASLTQIPISLIESKNNYIVSLECTDSFKGPKFSKILKINKNGSITDSLILNNYSEEVIQSIVKINDTLIGAYGYGYESDSDSLVVVLLTINMNLKLINQNNFKTNLTYKYYITSRSAKIGDAIFHVLGYNIGFNADHSQGFIIIKLNEASEILDKKIIMNDKLPCVAENILMNKKQDGFYLFSRYDMYGFDCQLNNSSYMRLDTIFKNEYDMAGPYHAYWLDSNIAISGNTARFEDFSFKLNLVSDDFKGLKSYKFETKEIEMPSYYNGISVYNDKLYLSGTSKFNFDYYGKESSLRVIKVDNDFNISWDKYFKSNNGYYYLSLYTLATNDGGCLIAATRNNSDQNPERLDLYLLKVDSLGNYIPLSISEEDTKPEKVRVYPNPGNTELKLDIPYFYPGLILNLYSVSGHKVLSELLISNQNIIHTQKLPVGMYIFELQINNKILERGKWVKQ